VFQFATKTYYKLVDYSTINNGRIAKLAGVVGVLSTVVKVVPVVVLGGMFEQDLPEWLPTVGTRQ
jgi:hypothetical protein